MAWFQYTARSPEGERVEGQIEANDQRQALVLMERKGLYPIAVRESSRGGDPTGAAEKAKKKFVEWRRTPKKRMSLREVLMLSRELSDLLASGMTLGHALHSLAQRKTGKAQDRIVEEIRDEIVQGGSLSESLSARPKSFPTLYVSVVRAGEAAGKLSESLEQICDYYERVLEARDKVLMALLYPSIVMVMGVLTIAFLMVFVVPRFTNIFDSLGGTLPLSTRMLVGISDGLLTYGPFILAGLVIGYVMFKRFLKTPRGQFWWHDKLLKIPVVKQVVSANAFAHFSRTLGALLRNGVPVLQALTIVEETVGNRVIAREIHSARDRVTDGSSISGPLAAGRIFPRLLTDMLAVGEQSGDMSGALKHISKRYDDELNRSVKMFTTVLEPIMILFIAIMVGFIAISMLMAVFDMTSGLNV